MLEYSTTDVPTKDLSKLVTTISFNETPPFSGLNGSVDSGTFTPAPDGPHGNVTASNTGSRLSLAENVQLYRWDVSS